MNFTFGNVECFLAHVALGYSIAIVLSVVDLQGRVNYLRSACAHTKPQENLANVGELRLAVERIQLDRRTLGQHHGEASASLGGRGLSRGPRYDGLVQVLGQRTPGEFQAVLAVEISSRGPVRTGQLRLLGENLFETVNLVCRLETEQIHAYALAGLASFLPSKVVLKNQNQPVDKKKSKLGVLTLYSL